MGTTYQSKRLKLNSHNLGIKTKIKIQKHIKKRSLIQHNHKITQRWSLKIKIKTCEYWKLKKLGRNKSIWQGKKVKRLPCLDKKTLRENEWLKHQFNNKSKKNLI